MVGELWYQVSIHFWQKELSHYNREKLICNSGAINFLFLTTVGLGMSSELSAVNHLLLFRSRCQHTSLHFTGNLQASK